MEDSHPAIIDQATWNRAQEELARRGSNLIIVPEEAEVVQKIFDLYLQGYGCRKIKRWLEEHGIKP